MRSLLKLLLLAGSLLPGLRSPGQPPSLHETPPPCQDLVCVRWFQTFEPAGRGWTWHCEQIRLDHFLHVPDALYAVPPGYDLVILRMVATVRTRGGEPHWKLLALPPFLPSFPVVERMITLPAPPRSPKGCDPHGKGGAPPCQSDPDERWEVYDEIPFGRGMCLPAESLLQLVDDPGDPDNWLKALECYGYLEPAGRP